MFPSIETMVIGIVITTALAVVDWYLWRVAPVLKYPVAGTGPRYTEREAGFKEVAQLRGGGQKEGGGRRQCGKMICPPLLYPPRFEKMGEEIKMALAKSRGCLARERRGCCPHRGVTAVAKKNSNRRAPWTK